MVGDADLMRTNGAQIGSLGRKSGSATKIHGMRVMHQPPILRKTYVDLITAAGRGHQPVTAVWRSGARFEHSSVTRLTTPLALPLSLGAS